MKINGVDSHFIGAWLTSERFYLKSPFYMACEDHSWYDFWIGFDAVVPLHEAADFPLVSFEKSRSDCFDYLSGACEILGRNMPKWSPDKGKQSQILAQLGPPPVNAYTIYVISTRCSDTQVEKVVYIGKTNSKSHRFRGGHAAISKLHAPEFEGMQKAIYFGCLIGINHDGNYVPIDWVDADAGRDQILSDVEAQLIFHLKPRLNTVGKDKCGANQRVPLHVQNLKSSLLDAQSFDEEFRLHED